MLARPDDGAVDHLQAVGRGIELGRALVERLKDRLPKPCKRPAAELSVNARPLAELLGEVPPGAPRPGDPEHAVEHPPMVAPLPPVARPHTPDERLEERPLRV